MERVFNQIVSLGPNCRAKFQIRQNFNKYSGRRGVFDWQGTPPEALIEYLRRDYVGMFERDDLQIIDGKVSNRRFGTSYLHLFPDVVTEEILEAHYPAARENHDRWCRTTKTVLTSDLSTLFVLCKPVAKPEMDEIARLIEQMAPHRKFLLLPCPDGDDEQDWAGDHALWREHLSRFEIRPPLRMTLALKLRRLLRKILRKRNHFPLAGDF